MSRSLFKIIGWILASVVGICSILGFIAVTNEQLAAGAREKWGIIRSLLDMMPTTDAFIYLYLMGMIMSVACVVGLLFEPWRIFRRTETNTESAVRAQLLKVAGADFSPHWAGDIRNALRPCLGERYVREFDMALWNGGPGRGKAYVENLLSRLDGAVLRASRIEKQRESPRFVSACDMIRELIDGAPQLDGRFTQAARDKVIKWRERAVTTIQELLADEHGDACLKVLAALAIVGTQSPDEVRTSVEDAIRQLRLIYTKLDEAMLSKTFRLNSGQYNAAYPIDSPPA